MDYQVVILLVARLRHHMSHKEATVVCMTNKDMYRVWKEECDLSVQRFKKRNAVQLLEAPIVEFFNLYCPMCHRPSPLLRKVPVYRSVNGVRTGNPLRTGSKHVCVECGYRWRMLR